MEQHGEHDALLGMVRAIAGRMDERADIEHRRVDVLQQQVDEM